MRGAAEGDFCWRSIPVAHDGPQVYTQVGPALAHISSSTSASGVFSARNVGPDAPGAVWARINQAGPGPPAPASPHDFSQSPGFVEIWAQWGHFGLSNPLRTCGRPTLAGLQEGLPGKHARKEGSSASGATCGHSGHRLGLRICGTVVAVLLVMSPGAASALLGLRPKGVRAGSSPGRAPFGRGPREPLWASLEGGSGAAGRPPGSGSGAARAPTGRRARAPFGTPWAPEGRR